VSVVIGSVQIEGRMVLLMASMVLTFVGCFAVGRVTGSTVSVHEVNGQRGLQTLAVSSAIPGSLSDPLSIPRSFASSPASPRPARAAATAKTAVPPAAAIVPVPAVSVAPVPVPAPAPAPAPRPSSGGSAAGAGGVFDSSG
jgi:hypothetical protein